MESVCGRKPCRSRCRRPSTNALQAIDLGVFWEVLLSQSSRDVDCGYAGRFGLGTILGSQKRVEEKLPQTSKSGFDPISPHPLGKLDPPLLQRPGLVQGLVQDQHVVGSRSKIAHGNSNRLYSPTKCTSPDTWLQPQLPHPLSPAAFHYRYS